MGRPRVMCTEVEKLFHEGFSGRQIADTLGLSVNTVYMKLRTLGLSITERDHGLRPGTVRQQNAERKGKSLAHYDGTDRYLQLERVVRRNKSIEISYDGLDYTCVVGERAGAPMRSIEAAIDSALAVGWEEDL